MPSSKQIELFRRLTEDRELGPMEDMPKLREKFGTLTDRNASAWIEKALDKSKRAEGDSDSDVPAPF